MRYFLLLVLSGFLIGCANDPYYLSEIDLSGDRSKDGATGAAIGFHFNPNPAYKLPTGYTK